jgi:hypothetical protein
LEGTPLTTDGETLQSSCSHGRQLPYAPCDRCQQACNVSAAKSTAWRCMRSLVGHGKPSFPIRDQGVAGFESCLPDHKAADLLGNQRAVRGRFFSCAPPAPHFIGAHDAVALPSCGFIDAVASVKPSTSAQAKWFRVHEFARRASVPARTRRSSSTARSSTARLATLPRGAPRRRCRRPLSASEAPSVASMRRDRERRSGRFLSPSVNHETCPRDTGEPARARSRRVVGPSRHDHA